MSVVCFQPALALESKSLGSVEVSARIMIGSGTIIKSDDGKPNVIMAMVFCPGTGDIPYELEKAVTCMH
jgi:hypothetical protein